MPTIRQKMTQDEMDMVNIKRMERYGDKRNNLYRDDEGILIDRLNLQPHPDPKRRCHFS